MKFKTLYTLLIATMCCFAIFSCEEDTDVTQVDNVATPSDLAVDIQLTTDNSGVATFTPSGESVAFFTIEFGDGNVSSQILPGETASNMYNEGAYTATIIATNLNGDTANITQDVVISFAAPDDLIVNITPVSGDNLSINVSAMATNAVGFEVFFGDVMNEAPTPLMVGETISHTYATTGVYEVTVVALSGGTATTQVVTTVTIVNPVLLPIDFESTTLDYAFSDFGGATTMLASNPDATGENTSNTVAQFFKEQDAEVFAGTAIELGAPIDFTQLQGINVKTYAPQAGVTVKLKIENGPDNTISAEIDAVTTVENAWETLSFDFSGTDFSQEYSRIILFFDFGNTGTGATYYFDDIVQSNGAGTGAAVALPVTFEDSMLTYEILGFEGAESEVEANPVASGINTSATVVRTTKTMGAQFFAGTIVFLDTPIDFNTSEIVTIKTYSPKANIPVRLKLESPDGSQFVELDAMTTVENEWETLSWDFTGVTENNVYTKAVLFFEFVVDLPGDGTTYYFDDIQLQ